jgi:cell division transport system permease protein
MAIDRLTKIFDVSRKIGIGISLALALVAFLVTFNTIRLAIYTAREEIGVMRLVGASNRFISGPFVVEGIMGGIISAAVATILFYPMVLWLGPKTKDFFGGIDLLDYYVRNFFQLLGILLLAGSGLGALSSVIAIRRHLKV